VKNLPGTLGLLVIWQIVFAAAPLRAENSVPAVVSIFTIDANGNALAHATGFFVSSDGLLVSTRHALRNASSAVVLMQDGSSFPVEGIVADDPLRDLLLLRVKGAGFPFLKTGFFAQIRANTEVSLFTIGAIAQRLPRHIAETLLIRGMVCEVENLADDYQWFAMEMAVKGGESGSPVVAPTGEVIGMLRGGFAHSARGQVVSVDYINQLVSAAADADPRGIGSLQKRQYDDLFDDPDFKAAYAAGGKEDNESAARLMKLALGRFPKSGAFQVLLGSYYSKLSRWKEAEEAFRKAIDLNSSNALAWASLGMELASQGDSAHAAEACEKAVSLETWQPATWFNIGATNLVLGHPEEVHNAIQHLAAFKSREADAYADKLRGVKVAKGPGNQ
jgi:tetratricopeptide (TPR) repeat protein